VLRQILATNPVVKTFLTLLERPHPHPGLSLLGPTVIEHIIQNSIDRGPIESMVSDALRQLVSAVVDVGCNYCIAPVCWGGSPLVSHPSSVAIF